jgi:hypothetical protein
LSIRSAAGRDNFPRPGTTPLDNSVERYFYYGTLLARRDFFDFHQCIVLQLCDHGLYWFEVVKINKKI